ncbi:MAG TPA: oxidoreductase-like domain-containing protein [Stenotrophobium sp.]|nr:oxidoreductase-like domain-containing protein [Stenotrophobium sp.]
MTEPSQGPDDGLELPPMPEPPIASDCCGGGCADCVYTIYDRQIYEWQQRVKELRREHAEKISGPQT